MQDRRKGRKSKRGKDKKKSKSQLKAAKRRAAQQETKQVQEPEVPAYVTANAQEQKSYGKDVHIPNFTMPRPGGGAELLMGTDIQLTEGRRYGLVGRNGFGKTTLLKHLASYEIPEFPSHLRVLHVKQEMPGDDTTVLEAVLKSDGERDMLLKEEHDLNKKSPNERNSTRLMEVHERLDQIDASTAPTRAALVLSGLQFSEQQQQIQTKELSGGWRMRVSLASALFVEPDILLLDEPTNHLDFPAVEWLIDYLQSYPKTLVVVSHDRKFLNEVCTDVIHIEDQKLKYYKGDYDTFLRVRTEHRKQQKTAYDKQRATIEHNEDFIRRFRANKKLSSLAQSRVKLISHMEKLEDVVSDYEFRFQFPEPAPLRKDELIKMDDLYFGYYGDDPTKRSYLLRNINLKLKVGTVVGVLGANGAGKSTMIKLIMGQEEAVAGHISVNKAANIGFFAQHHGDTLQLDETPLSLLQKLFPESKLQDVYHKLGQFNLAKECAKQRIGDLSGGQKSRVTFAILTWNLPHLLIMDEPTNHLDLDTIDGLIDAIQKFKGGGVVLVSHDEHFLKSVCNEYWAIGPSKQVRAFSDFASAKKFSYKKNKVVELGHNEKLMEKKLANSLATLEIKEPEVVEEVKKPVKAKKKDSSNLFEEDTLGLVERALSQGKSPQQLKRLVQRTAPKDNQQILTDVYTFHIFKKYFSDMNLDDHLLQQWAPFLKHMLPHDQPINQLTMLYNAQAIWYRSWMDRSRRALVEDSFLILLNELLSLEVTSLENVIRWRDDTSNKASGKAKAVKQAEKLFATEEEEVESEE